MTDYLSEKIKRLEEYNPNTTVYQVRMDANESPYAVSDALRAEFLKLIEEIEFNRYPDPYTSRLIGTYSKLIGVKPENIAAGNGSDELISIICSSFLSKDDPVVVTVPDFSMYAFYSGIIEAKLVEYIKTDGYKIDFSELAELIHTSGAKLVLLSNPCNPTSKCYSSGEILDFVKKAGCLCVIDEAYMDFSGVNESVIDQATFDATPNLLVLKTLSKLGLAALRCGFLLGNKTLIDGIKKVKSPYNVNTLTQALAECALRNYAEFDAHLKEIRGDTESLYRRLDAMHTLGGFTTIKPATNFVTLWFSEPERAKSIFSSLREKGISVRYTMGCCLRITCGTPSENETLLSELERLIKN